MHLCSNKLSLFTPVYTDYSCLTMRKLLFTALLSVVIVPLILQAKTENVVQYTIDLSGNTEDLLRVSMVVPPLSQKDTIVIFPASAPGTYDRLDFGRFVESLTAYDNDGNIVQSERHSVNTFRLSQPEKVVRIVYTLDDSWDEETADKSKRIFNPGGTNFQADTCFVLNYFAVCGYIPRYKKTPISVTIKKPITLKGVSSLPLQKSSASEDVYNAEDYDFLADNPALYARTLDTALLTIRGAKVCVAVYSENGKIHAKEVAGIVKPVITADADFLGKMPVSHYSFLFVFAASEKNNGDGHHGALEHSYSSMYYLPEPDNVSHVEGLIKHTVSHEFLHIKIPLHLHSKEIDDFDFLNPKMSKHLWLYEGVTEYFAHLSQIPLTGEEGFIRQTRQKIHQMEFYRKDVSLTELAVKVMEPEMQRIYPSIYDRGALIAMLLDIRLRVLSKGKKSLPWLVDTLSSMYGKNKPFDDEELFPQIVRLTAPEIQQFIDTFIVTSHPLPLTEYFEKIGYEFYAKRTVEGYKFENITIRYASENLAYLVPKSVDNAFGAMDDDEIVSVEDIPFNSETISDIVGILLRPKSDKEIKVTVKRNGELKELKGKPIKAEVNENNALVKKEVMTSEQKDMHNSIFGNR